MKKEIIYYTVSPAVVPADKVSTVEIRCHEQYYGFKDGVKYRISFMPYSIPSTPFPDSYGLLDIGRSNETIEVICENGTLRFERYFPGEQKWRMHVGATENTFENELYEPYRSCWGSLLSATKTGNTLEMYSLAEDLMKLRPYKGDLHLHTHRSDGIESPETTVANYRKFGYDFLAITDHHIYNSMVMENEKLKGLKTQMAVYNGEEVHSDYIGQIHMVNFDSASSVNDRIRFDRDAVLAEIEDLKGSPELSDVTDKTDIAWRIWVYREIKKSGGLCIFPHPYWEVCGGEHASPEAIEYTFKNHLMDAFEVYGGVDHRKNNLQALLYQDMKDKGYSYPLVASTDSHTSREHGEDYFGIAYTIAFAEDVHSVRSAVENGLTVGVQCEPGKDINITGSLRLAKYANFLIENYFPLHDELCNMSGIMMRKYVLGDTEKAKMMCEATEEYIGELEIGFFGAR